MVDLDSNPTKLLEVVHIGKQMLMTRGLLVLENTRRLLLPSIGEPVVNILALNMALDAVPKP
ncbi:MAG: hypothetical protein ACR5LF_01055 [Symbiopectobacterium sp.]